MIDAQKFSFRQGFDAFGIPDALPQIPLTLIYRNLNRIYFENRSFSSSGSRCFLTHKRSLKNSGVVLIRC